MSKVNLSLIVIVCISAQVFAGSLEPPAGPDDEASAMYSIEAIYQRLSTGTNVAKRGAGFRGPTGPPGSTMHNLNDVMAKAPSNVVDAVGATTNEVLSGQIFWGLTTNEWGTQTGAIATRTLLPDTNEVQAGYYTSTNLSQVDTDLSSANIIGGITIFGVTGAIPTRTLSSNTPVVDAGYYATTNLTEVDTDLVTNNIRVDVAIFGVTGTVYECSVPKTGQTISHRDGDDGWYSTNYGVAWPNPRFTVGTGINGTNLVTDNLTGLMWARNANLLGGSTNWEGAIDFCNNLNYGGHTDWRLPNTRQLDSLIHYGVFAPALPNTAGTGQWTNNDPFTNVPTGQYWTSTEYGTFTYAFFVRPHTAQHGNELKTTEYYVWPVRGGP